MSLYSGKPCCLACYKKWSEIEARFVQRERSDAPLKVGYSASTPPANVTNSHRMPPFECVAHFRQVNRCPFPQVMADAEPVAGIASVGCVLQILLEKQALRLVYRLLPPCSLVSD